jgi:hypothetical protein
MTWLTISDTLQEIPVSEIWQNGTNYFNTKFLPFHGAGSTSTILKQVTKLMLLNLCPFHMQTFSFTYATVCHASYGHMFVSHLLQV